MTNSALWKGTNTWVQRTTPKIATGVGLFLILGGVLYLLAGFSAALDAISFQDRVLRVVGDDNRMQARSVLNKLDQLHRSEPSDRPKDSEGLPIETLALQLDRVKAATTLLSSFNSAILLPDVPADRAEKTNKQSEIIENWFNTIGTDSQPEQKEIIELLQKLDLVDENMLAKMDTEGLMQDLGINLNYELDRLNTEINDNVSGIKLVRSLDKIQDVLVQIKTKKDLVSTLKGNGSETADTTLTINLAADQFKERLTQLETYLGQFDNIMPTAGSEEASARQHLNSAMVVFKEIGPLTNGSVSLIHGNLDKIFDLLATIENSVAAIDALIAEPKPEAMNAMFSKLQADAETINDLLAMDDPIVSGLDDPLKNFNEQTVELAAHIRTTLPEFETIQKITPALAQMEIASNALSRLVVDSERINIIIDGQSVTGFEAANIHKKQLDALAKAITSMTDSLKELSDEGLLAQLLTDDPEALAKASTLLRDHEKISRAEFPLNVWGWKLIDPAVLAVASREKLDIMMVLIVGAIGSMIYMTQRMLKMLMHGKADDLSQHMPFLWYLARPVFGAVVAFAVYLIYKTGQIAFGTGGLTEALEDGTNIPILTVLGLFAGLLSWQALDMIQSKGEVWLKSGTRRPLWATGLARVLEAKDQTEESCSQHLGVTIGQIDRWICCKDEVVPEMQDRMSTWLVVKNEELFSTTTLARTQKQTPMFAIGLKPSLQQVDAHHSIKSIALALGVEDKTVKQWRDQKQPVSREYQWQLVELVNERFAIFFSTKEQTDQYWAVGFRACMSIPRFTNARALATKLRIDEEWVKKWRDLYEPVPSPTARLIAETMQVEVNALFDPQFDHLHDRYLVDKPALKRAIVAKYVAEAGTDSSRNWENALSAFAKDMDVSEIWVHDWLEGRKLLFAPTRNAVALKLDQEENVLFTKCAFLQAPPHRDQPTVEEMHS